MQRALRTQRSASLELRTRAPQLADKVDEALRSLEPTHTEPAEQSHEKSAEVSAEKLEESQEESREAVVREAAWPSWMWAMGEAGAAGHRVAEVLDGLLEGLEAERGREVGHAAQLVGAVHERLIKLVSLN